MATRMQMIPDLRRSRRSRYGNNLRGATSLTKSIGWVKRILHVYEGAASKKFRIASAQLQIDTTHFALYKLLYQSLIVHRVRLLSGKDGIVTHLLKILSVRCF